MTPKKTVAASPTALMAELRVLIVGTRQTVAQGVNSALVLLYWQIGQRIRSDILKAKRADYGEQIFHALSGKFTSEFGRGFTKTNLFNMVRCAEAFPDLKTVHALSAQLSWTHLRRIVYIDDPLKRDFYAEITPRLATLRSAGVMRSSPTLRTMSGYTIRAARAAPGSTNAVQGRAFLDGVHRVMVGRNKGEVGARADLLVQAGLNGSRRAPWG